LSFLECGAGLTLKRKEIHGVKKGVTRTKNEVNVSLPAEKATTNGSPPKE